MVIFEVSFAGYLQDYVFRAELVPFICKICQLSAELISVLVICRILRPIPRNMKINT